MRASKLCCKCSWLNFDWIAKRVKTFMYQFWGSFCVRWIASTGFLLKNTVWFQRVINAIAKSSLYPYIDPICSWHINISGWERLLRTSSCPLVLLGLRKGFRQRYFKPALTDQSNWLFETMATAWYCNPLLPTESLAKYCVPSRLRASRT